MFLREFAEAGRLKLIEDNVIDNAAENIKIMPNGEPLPNRKPWFISIFQIKPVPIDPYTFIFRKFRITLTVRIIYRTRTSPLEHWDSLYGSMLDLADTIAISWDRSDSLKKSFWERINSTFPETRLGIAGDVVFTDMDTEPVPRFAEFFYLDEQGAETPLPVGYTLDLFFSSPAIAIQRPCG